MSIITNRPPRHRYINALKSIHTEWKRMQKRKNQRTNLKHQRIFSLSHSHSLLFAVNGPLGWNYFIIINACRRETQSAWRDSEHDGLKCINQPGLNRACLAGTQDLIHRGGGVHAGVNHTVNWEALCSIRTLSAITNGSQPKWVWDQVNTCLFYQACKVHGIVCFGDQSSNAEKSWPLSFSYFCLKLVCRANVIGGYIWTLSKWKFCSCGSKMVFIHPRQNPKVLWTSLSL